MGFEAFRFRERFKGGLPPGIVPPRAAQCTLRVLFAAFGGNFLHVRAAFSGGFAAIFPFPQFLTVEKLKITHYSSVVE